jgi:hypothetical protein
MPGKKPHTIYQLKITLEHSKPPIWRRILVPSEVSLGKFHFIIQIAMGWTNSHLHQFIRRGKMYGDAEFNDDFGPPMADENRHQLAQLLEKEKDSLTYEYDFGDGWQHKIILEKILPADETLAVPSCIKGKRACPPEDCGGIWGYADLLEIIKDPSHPEHEAMLEWLEEDFDPEHFSIEETNQALAHYS